MKTARSVDEMDAESKPKTSKRSGRRRVLLYNAVLRRVREEIRAGAVHCLSEKEIVRRFRVSNITARRVLNELREEGVLIRKQGCGSVVLSPLERVVDLAVVIFDIYRSDDAYVTTCLQRLEGLSAAKGYHLNLYTTRQKPVSETPASLLHHLVLKRRLRAAFFVSPLAAQDALFFQRHGIPVVAMGNRYPGLSLNTVVFDHRNAVTQVMARLMDEGCRRVALLTGRPPLLDAGVITGTEEIHDAYREALRAHGVPYDPALALAREQAEEEGYAVAALLSQESATRCEAVVIPSAILARGALRYLQTHPETPLKVVAYSHVATQRPCVVQDASRLAAAAFEVAEGLLERGAAIEASRLVEIPLDVVW